MSNYKVGTVALVGRPNVGKSTLVNLLLDYQLSIVTPKPQTTRDNILGLYTDSESQIMLIDTPGIHRPKHLLGQRLVERARATLDSCDCVVFVVTPEDRADVGADKRVIEVLKTVSVPCIVLINKVDQPGAKAAILPVMDQFHRALPEAELLPFSAKTGFNKKVLLELIKDRLPEGELIYPEDQITDRSERFIAGEVIRSCIMEGTDDEVPHSVAVSVEEYKSPDEYPERDSLYIRADIHVERAGQKAILLGAKGSKMKIIRAHARRRLAQLTGWPIELELWVKVTKGWRDSTGELKRLGYGTMENQNKDFSAPKE